MGTMGEEAAQRASDGLAGKAAEHEAGDARFWAWVGLVSSVAPEFAAEAKQGLKRHGTRRLRSYWLSFVPYGTTYHDTYSTQIAVFADGSWLPARSTSPYTATFAKLDTLRVNFRTGPTVPSSREEVREAFIATLARR